MNNSNIYVTQPSLPPLEEFIPYLEKIWDSKVLTNSGNMHQILEKELCQYLGVPYISLFNNGTNALLTALQCFELSGEVITTPYSFIATSHALIWNNLQPVFVDIDANTLNIDSKKIEAAITDKTTAILAVHCYGNPCDTQAIQIIADKYKLRVIYDAAHAFGVEDNHGSILNYGDLSTLSFHATKVFNTFEGGAIISQNLETKERIDRLKNFGIASEVEVTDIGLNGKMSEINAAFGILQLQYVDLNIQKRQGIANIYFQELANITGISCPLLTNINQHNYAYFPILIDADTFGHSRDELYNKLKEHHIFARRYFYPLISDFAPYKKNNLVFNHAQKASEQVLCLPIYPTLEKTSIIKIVNILKVLS